MEGPIQRRCRFSVLALILLAVPCAGQIQPHLSVYSDPRLLYHSQMSLKVTDGTLAKSGELQAVVGLIRGQDPRPLCTGTIVGRGDMVLTAMHCVCDFIRGPHGNALVGISPVAHPQYYLVVGIVPGASCTASRAGRDFAMLKLNRLTGISPISFATPDQIDKASTFQVAGFGAIDYDGHVVDYQKRYAPVPSISSDCRGQRDGVPDPTVYGCVPDREIVAGQRRSPDTCNGDSGGPLMVTMPDGSYRLAGVTSRSIPNTPTACGSGGVYERVTAQTQTWMDSAIKSLGPPGAQR